MMDHLYYYLFYGSFTLMPILLLLILLTLQRCRIWSKRCAHKLDAISDEVESVKYSAESAITRHLSDYIPEKTHSIVSEIVEKQIRECDCLGEVRPEDVEFANPCDVPEEHPIKPFDINDLPPIDPEFEERFGPVIMEALALEQSYSDKYIKHPGINLNGVGMKRAALSPEHWAKLTSLGFVNETPVSVSAIVFNILVEHFSTHGKEIDEFVIIGDRNKNYGYGRY